MLPLSTAPPPAPASSVQTRATGEPVATDGEGDEFEAVLARIPDGKAQVPVEPDPSPTQASDAGPPPGACPVIPLGGELPGATTPSRETKGGSAAPAMATASPPPVVLPDPQEQAETSNSGDDSSDLDPSLAQVMALPVNVAPLPAKLVAAGTAGPGLTAAAGRDFGPEISPQQRKITSMDDKPDLGVVGAALPADDEVARLGSPPTVKHGHAAGSEAPASVNPAGDAAPSTAADAVPAAGDGLADQGRPGEFAFVALQPGFATDSGAGGISGAMSGHRPPAIVQSGIAATPAILGPEIARIARTEAGDAVEIQLAPHELGRLRIRVSPESDVARVTVQAERPETLDLLRRNGDVLIKELRAAGFAGGTLDFTSWSDGNQRSAPSMAQGQISAGEDFSFAGVRPVQPSGPARTDAGLYLRL